MWWCLIPLGFWLFAVGTFIGGRLQDRDCANAAISDDPPAWWKHRLIDAQARKDKEKVK